MDAIRFYSTSPKNVKILRDLMIYIPMNARNSPLVILMMSLLLETSPMASGMISSASASPLVTSNSDDSSTPLSPPRAEQRKDGLAASSFGLHCWQNGREVLSRRFSGDLRLGNQVSQRSLTLTSPDGGQSAAVLLEFGTAFCFAETGSTKP